MTKSPKNSGQESYNEIKADIPEKAGEIMDVIILGKGPAGISAAAYTARAGLKTMVIGRDGGSLAKAEKIENYYGFSEPISGNKLIEEGIGQAKRLGVDILSDEVLGISYNGNFIVQAKNKEYETKSIILATGSSRVAPRIKGLEKFEGKGISYCATCDAFFYQGKDVAVVGESNYALHEAKELLPLVRSVVILTDGKKISADFPAELKIYEQKIDAFEGDERLRSVVFDDGTKIDVNGVFIAMGFAGGTDLAKKIGAETDGPHIVVDAEMTTSVPGIYAAGDCTGGMSQIAKAVYEGAKAGTSVVKFIRDLQSQ